MENPDRLPPSAVPLNLVLRSHVGGRRRLRFMVSDGALGPVDDHLHRQERRLSAATQRLKESWVCWLEREQNVANKGSDDRKEAGSKTILLSIQSF